MFLFFFKYVRLVLHHSPQFVVIFPSCVLLLHIRWALHSGTVTSISTMSNLKLKLKVKSVNTINLVAFSVLTLQILLDFICCLEFGNRPVCAGESKLKE